MRSWLFALLFVMAFLGPAISQEDKKTDDDKPADPDTGESTIEEKTLGLLPNPLQKYGVKFAATYNRFGQALRSLRRVISSDNPAPRGRYHRARDLMQVVSTATVANNENVHISSQRPR